MVNGRLPNGWRMHHGGDSMPDKLDSTSVEVEVEPKSTSSPDDGASLVDADAVEDPGLAALAAVVGRVIEQGAPIYMQGLEFQERAIQVKARNASEQRAHDLGVLIKQQEHESSVLAEQNKDETARHKIDSEAHVKGQNLAFWFGLAALVAIVLIFGAAIYYDKVADITDTITQVGAIVTAFFALFKLGQKATSGKDKG